MSGPYVNTISTPAMKGLESMMIIISSVLFFSPALLAIGCGVAYSRKRRKAVVRKFAVDYREPICR